jgi:hypothetical protein
MTIFVNQESFMKVSTAIFCLVAVFYANSACAEGFEVSKVNDGGSRVIVKNAQGLNEGERLAFTDEFDETCVGEVVKLQKESAVLDISSCKNGKSVRVGSNFIRASLGAGPKAPLTTAKPSSDAPSIDEDWYTLWGLGFAETKYSDDEVEDAFDDAERVSGVDRTTVAYDLFGFYWPLDRQSMQGFVVNTVLDSLDGPGGVIDVFQHQYSYSYMRFYGANIGDGWFLRADVGLLKYSVDIDTDLYDDTGTSDFGIGLLAGGGYGFAIGQETRLLVGGYVRHGKADGDATSSLILNFGFLF